MKNLLRVWLVSTAFALAARGESELAVAKEALRDGLWEIARAHAGKVDGDEAKLVILESLAGEGRWDEIGKTLAGWKNLKGDGFDYYRAVVGGNHRNAMEILKRGGSVSGLVEVRMHEADALIAAGKRAEAANIWREVAAMTNVSERAFALASINLGDAALLRRAYETVRSTSLRRLVAVRLGSALLRDVATAEEGERLIRAIVSDFPDADGAENVFLELADSAISAGQWEKSLDIYNRAVEIWPDAVKRSELHEGRGWSLQRLGRREDALKEFALAREFATNDEACAIATLKEGDVLSELGQGVEAMAKYREVLGKYSGTDVARRLKSVIKIREQESNGLELYKEYRFAEARKVFAEVAAADAARKPRMQFLEVLCFYGEGQDDEAGKKATELANDCRDKMVKAEATRWLAKFSYNHREWKGAIRLFTAYADIATEAQDAAEALMWASRAAFADGDFNSAIQLSTKAIDRCQNSPAKPLALLVQGETLIELGRFDEAVLVLERVAIADQVTVADRIRSQLLKADALYAMGADNPARYTAALEAYNAIRFGGMLSKSGELVVSFKIARVLEKMKRIDEAMDQYYARVVLAYREGRDNGVRFDDEARAVFSRAAFRLADEYESRGNDRQASGVLELVVGSDVPAAKEAARRLESISKKGRFL